MRIIDRVLLFVVCFLLKVVLVRIDGIGSFEAFFHKLKSDYEYQLLEKLVHLLILTCRRSSIRFTFLISCSTGFWLPY